jgi:hypothetical protein
VGNTTQKAGLSRTRYFRSFWGILAANLIIVAVWAYLAWLVFGRSPKSLWVGGIYLVVGIILTAFLPIQLTIPEEFRKLVLIDQTRYIRAALLESGLSSRFVLSAMHIAMLGAASLLPRKERQEMRESGDKEIG